MAATLRRPSSVAIIVLNWNTPGDTLECLESLRQLRYEHCTVVVVDNGSTDGSERQIRAAYPELPFLQTGKNLGYAGGNNAGIRYALEQGAEFVWLLNSDTAVAPDSLDRLVQSLRDEAVGIAGSVLLHYRDRDTGKRLDPSNKVQFNGGRIFWRRGETHSYSVLGERVDTSRDIPTEYVHGASMLVRRAVFEQIGLIPDFYFLNYEESDFCVQAAKKGWRMVVNPRAIVWHKVGASMGQLSLTYFYYMHRNVWFFVMRHAPLMQRALFVPYYVTMMLKGYARSVAGRQPDGAAMFLRPMTDAWMGRKGEAELRKKDAPVGL